ncbi:unnamed protein product [Cylindrotheca closterium]|uniref:G-protein coupled receptors family 3 profile domain-containing protein n=1 Tax=Cylindrotheca closterium TaxID=2856 RepID=A0AAD2CN00_9STRA|nr:unnamed protein product [Cylindrotheca closterium]
MSWVRQCWALCLLFLFLALSSCPTTQAQKCDPCIERSEYNLKAILHGGSDDSFWLEIQAAMRQAALDMRVNLELELSPETLSPEEMALRIVAAIDSRDSFDALIVTIPSPEVKTAVKSAIDSGIPVFGLNLGSEDARSIGVRGFVAQDEYRAGQAAAEEFARITNVTNALLIHSDIKSQGLEARSRGFVDAFANMHNVTFGTNATVVDEIFVDATDIFGKVTSINRVFEENCRYDAVMVVDEDTLQVALAASQEHNCGGITHIGAFDETPTILSEVIAGNVAFGVSQQHYLQGVLPVYMASIYVTTQKTLALPVDEDVYLAGPTIIRKDNVPTDALQQCAKDAFPICPNTKNPSGDEAICECTDKKAIRIGGVLHGITTDTFWDPVFASARQAADDMDVELALIRFQPDANDQIYFQMAARIKALCEDGVDGIFVTIPSDVVLDSIMRCKELNVPVVSINSGGDKSLELDLLNHIGMVEYSAGYGAGTRMVAAGMKKGYCLQHEFGILSLIERCRGFEDAINEFGQGATFQGSFDVSRDNKVEYGLQVEAAVANPNGDWAGVGLLLTGSVQVPAYTEFLVPKHPEVLAGSFDLSPDVYAGIDGGTLLFGIDQVPYLQGNTPVYTLTIEAYTKQVLKNHFLETGPSFVLSPPSDDQIICEGNFYQVCTERPEEDYNTISEGLHIFGFAALGILLGLCACCLAWMISCRDLWVVRISQPLFLYIILFGTVVSSIAIPFLGFETEYRFVQDIASGELTSVVNPEIGTVDAACMAVPWLYGLGFAITFSAMFAKIQRVRLIYRAGVEMRRKRVELKDVASIMVVIMTIEGAILLTWQLYDPHQWERVVLQEDEGFTTESYGYCTSDSGNYFWMAIVAFHVVCLLYALVLAFQTKDINAEYAESGSLFLAVMFMFQTQVLVIPLVALVQDDSNVFFFIRCIAVLLQNFTVLLLLFVPKMYKTLKGEGNVNPANQARIDLSARATNTGRISGVNMTNASLASRYGGDMSGQFDADDSSRGFGLEDMGTLLRRTDTSSSQDKLSSEEAQEKAPEKALAIIPNPKKTLPPTPPITPLNNRNSSVSSVDVWASQCERVDEESEEKVIAENDDGSAIGTDEGVNKDDKENTGEEALKDLA